MRSGFRIARPVVALAALLCGAACSDNPKTGSDKFVGTWVYAGMINGTCGGQAVSPIDLTGYSVTITATDPGHITVQLGTSCTVKFDVDGFVATAQGKQSCMFEIGSFGQQTVSIAKWTLTSTTTDTVASDFTGTAVSGLCMAAGTGTLTRVGDAGATD